MKSFLVLGAALVATPAAGETLRDAVATDMPSLMAIYRELHANPELSFEEVKSAARMAAEVRKLGFEVTTGVGGHGVVAVMRNGPGPTLLIRADMDGLPLTEQTDLPFAITRNCVNSFVEYLSKPSAILSITEPLDAFI